MSFPSISVIVPIYNMEHLMRKCIDSIISQSYSDFELLLIDDGSQDASGGICDEYARQDVRIKAYHKANGGLSDTRNYGIAKAQGEYFIFFDPDDWVDADCLRVLHDEAVSTNADVVMCDILINDGRKDHYCHLQPKAPDRKSVLKDVLSGRIPGYTPNKLIRRECYVKYNISYPIDIYGCEDQYAFARLLKNDVRIAYIPKAFYHYVKHDGSLSRKYDETTYNMNLKIRQMFKELFRDTEFEDFVYIRKTSSMVWGAFQFGRDYYTSKTFKETFKKEEKNFFEWNKSFRAKFFMKPAFNGFYTLSRSLFQLGLYAKRWYRKIQ